MHFAQILQRFITDDRGSETVEFGVMAGILAALIAVAVLLLAPGVKQGFTNLNDIVATPPAIP
jgi:Flp pilus assembly pilin Flp